jgi:spore coat polysaccharide biosynthesis protein SpsF
LVATSRETADAAVFDLVTGLGLDCFRGSLEDVLDRFYCAAAPHRPSHVVRLTGDCPLADRAIIDAVVRLAVDGRYDYASNVVRRTYPDGLDVEIMTFQALEIAWREATAQRHREHVTPFLYEQADRFRIGCLENARDLSNLRWTVDERADYDFVRCVYAGLYHANPDFGMQDIIAYLQANPRVARLNAHLVPTVPPILSDASKETDCG